MADAANPFDMSAFPFGKLGPMLESVELFNKTWSSLSGIPSRLLPTVDVNELGQRITELKTVEQWLTLNLNWLRQSIQGMEMQRDTLSAVKAFSDTHAEGLQQASAAWAQASESFKTAPGGAPTPAAEGATSPFSGFRFPFEGMTPAAAPASPEAEAPAAEATEPTGSSPPSMNPGLWWSMLQANFNQVAEAALASVARPRAGSEAPPATAAEPATDPDPEPEPAAPAAREDDTRRPSAHASSRQLRPVPLVRPSRSGPRNPR